MTLRKEELVSVLPKFDPYLRMVELLPTWNADYMGQDFNWLRLVSAGT